MKIADDVSGKDGGLPARQDFVVLGYNAADRESIVATVLAIRHIGGLIARDYLFLALYCLP